ncbi:MAG: GNAT family N-acetyltransferase [Chloroflexi bacterium]|jgi:GNAT superfamily N-acetyltransferase|nr:GNAT family N-acetyltransferase [Chloroflexota bacterium]
MSSLTIRPFERRDQAAAKTLILEGLVEHWGALDPTLNPDLDDIATTYAEGRFLTAWQGKRLVGTGAILPEAGAEGTARVVRMSVARGCRRQGIGRALLDALCATARKVGYRRLVLETTATWHGVIDFYEIYGFRALGVREGNMHFEMDL